MSSSRAIRAARRDHSLPATYACDICEGAVSAAHVHTEDGKILGLIACTQCVEDNLASAVEPRAEVGLSEGAP